MRTSNLSRSICCDRWSRQSFLRPDLRPPNPGAAGGRGSPPGLAGDLSLAGLASAMSVKRFD